MVFFSPLILFRAAKSIQLDHGFFSQPVSSAVGLVSAFIVSHEFLYFRPFQKYGTTSDLLITHGASSLSNLCTFVFQRIIFNLFFLKMYFKTYKHKLSGIVILNYLERCLSSISQLL